MNNPASNPKMAMPVAAEPSAEPRVDTELLEACARGDQQAFRILFEAYKDRVYAFALRFLGDDSHAADLTQDIFVKLYQRIKEFRGDSRFETWLYRVVANACIDDQRRRKRFLPWLTDEHPSLVSGPNLQERSAARKQTSTAIHVAISKLTPTLRVPILLRYMQELSYEEIAEVLGISIGTVASRLNRGHKLLAKKLEKYRGMTV